MFCRNQWWVGRVAIFPWYQQNMCRVTELVFKFSICFSFVVLWESKTFLFTVELIFGVPWMFVVSGRYFFPRGPSIWTSQYSNRIINDFLLFYSIHNILVVLRCYTVCWSSSQFRIVLNLWRSRYVSMYHSYLKSYLVFKFFIFFWIKIPSFSYFSFLFIVFLHY